MTICTICKTSARETIPVYMGTSEEEACAACAEEYVPVDTPHAGLVRFPYWWCPVTTGVVDKCPSGAKFCGDGCP